MTITHHLRTIKTDRFEVTIDCLDFCTPTEWLEDLFETCKYHEGGVTIRNPINPGDDRCHQWYKPTQYTLAELASDYAKQGRENPSREAYESARRDLAWYITASEFGLLVTIKKDGITLIENPAGLCFDYSHQESEENIEDYVWSNFRDVITECLHESIEAARAKLKQLAA